MTDDAFGEEGLVADDLLRVEGLVKRFPIRGGALNRVVNHVQAVNGVSFTVKRGEVLGLVGESGSGKTTVGRLILRLEEATDGKVVFDGTNILELSRADMRRFRKRMQIIFQDPYASLNPREKVRTVIGHALALHRIGTPESWADRTVELLELREQRIRKREADRDDLDKTCRLFASRSQGLEEQNKLLREAIENAPCVYPGQPTMSPGSYCEHDCDCWKRAALQEKDDGQ